MVKKKTRRREDNKSIVRTAIVCSLTLPSRRSSGGGRPQQLNVPPASSYGSKRNIRSLRALALRCILTHIGAHMRDSAKYYHRASCPSLYWNPSFTSQIKFIWPDGNDSTTYTVRQCYVVPKVLLATSAPRTLASDITFDLIFGLFKKGVSSAFVARKLTKLQLTVGHSGRALVILRALGTKVIGGRTKSPYLDHPGRRSREM